MSQQTPKNRVLFVRRFTPVVLVLFGVLSLLTLCLRSPQPVQAATTSSTINFQARLEASSGAIAADGNYNVEFKLYGGTSCNPATGSGCSALWTEDYLNSASQGVRVANGYLSVSLGSITAFPATINWDQPLYISMNIGGTTTGTVTWDGVMLPYLQLTAVPYAFRSGQLATTNTAGTYASTLGIQAPTGGNQTFVLQDQGAAGTYDLLTQNASTGVVTIGKASSLTGQLTFGNAGSANTITLTTAAETVGSATITIPNTAGANDTVCLQTLANCTGVSGGSVGGSGTANTIAMFTGSGYTIGNSIMSQTGTTIGVAGTLQATTLNANAVQTNGSTRIDVNGNFTGGTINTDTLNSTSLTFSGANPVISGGGTGSLGVDTSGAGTLNLGSTNATVINVGGGTVNETLGIGNSSGNDIVNIATATGTDTVNIGTSTSSQATVNVGSSYSTTSVKLQGGTSSLSVSNSGLTITGNTTTSGTVSTSAGGAAGTGTQQLASNLYIQSRSTNLVANGTGLLGDNYNFSSFTFDPQNVYAGAGSFKNSTYSAAVYNDELIPVDPSSTYQLNLSAESTVYVSGAHAYFGVAPYDIDGNQITPPNYAKYSGSTDTTLAAPLNPGDTTVQLTNASGWWNSGGSAATYAQLVWYGYTNAKGYTYPNYTYTRNSTINYSSLYNSGSGVGAWAAGGISGNTITLTAPWPGPALPTGAAVRNAQSGGTYKYIAASNVNVPATWQTYSGRIGGIDVNGTQNANLFPYGTAYVKLLFLMNRDVTGNTTNISDISFTNNSGVLVAPTASTVPVIIQGAASQTGDLLDLQNAGGTVLTKVDASGNVTSSGTLTIQGSSTSTFTNTLQVGSGSASTIGVMQFLTGGASPIANRITYGTDGSGWGFAISKNQGGTITDQFVVKDNGNVGIGTTAPSTLLSLGSSITQQKLAIYDGGSASTFYGFGLRTGYLDFQTAGTTRLTIDSSGNVGIGNTAPAALLGVGSSSQFRVDSSGNLSTTGTATVQTATNSTTAFQVQNASANPAFVVDTNTNRNLVSNSGFETTPYTSGWAGTNATLGSVVGNGVYEGNRSLLVNVTTAGGGAQLTGFTSTLTPNNYNFSFETQNYNNSGTLGVIVTGGSATCTLNATTMSTAGYQRYNCSISSSTTNITAITITSTGTGQFQVDAVQLSIGSGLQQYNGAGAIQLLGLVDSPVTIQPQGNSTTAFQIQNSVGTSNLFVADTMNNRIGIGTNAPVGLFSVGSSSQFQVDVNGNFTTTGTGLVKTTNATAFQVQNASGYGLLTVNSSNNTVNITTGVVDTTPAVAQLNVTSNWTDTTGDMAIINFGEGAATNLNSGQLRYDGQSNRTSLGALNNSGNFNSVLSFGYNTEGVLLENRGSSASTGMSIINYNSAAGIVLKPGSGADSATAVQIQNAAGAALLTANTSGMSITIAGNVVVGAGKSITITGGNTASRPASPTSGMLYYDTSTSQLLQYNGSKWVSAPRTATEIVAASNSSQAEKDAADFVATGTSDQTTINAALAALPATGGSVYLMEGTYTLGATSINVPDNTTLTGAGAATILTYPSSMANATYSAITNSDTSTGTHVYVQNLLIDGNKAGQTTGTFYGIYFNGVGSSTRDGGKVTNVVVKNMFGSSSYGINLTSSSNNTIIGNTVQANGSGGIFLNGSQYNAITGNTVVGNAEGIYLFNSNYNTVTGNTSQGNSGDGIMLLSSNNTTITGNTSQGNGSAGINLSSGTYDTVSGNMVSTNSGEGIYLAGSNDTITGNRIHDNGGATTNEGITFSASSNSSVTDNDITDTSCTSTCYAIDIINTSNTKNYLSNNTFSGDGTHVATINDAGTGTVYSNQSRAENGGQLTIRTANDAAAFQIQDANGASVLTADSTDHQILISGGSGTASISAVQLWNLAGTNVSTLSVAPHTVGNLMTMAIYVYNNSVVVNSISGGGVTTWKRVTAITGTLSRTELWQGTVTSTGSSTITVSYSATPGNTTELVAQELTAGLGATTIWSVDSSSTYAGTSSTTVTYPSLTPSQSGSLYWGYAATAGASSAGSTPGFSYATTSNGDEVTYDPSLSAGTLYTPTSTQSPAGTSYTVGAVYIATTGTALQVNGALGVSGQSILGGGSNQAQLVVRANSSQSATTPLILLQNSSGGELARINSDSSGNIVFGQSAGSAMTSGYSNAAFGSNTLTYNTSGYWNTAVGTSALSNNTTGNFNIAVGGFALGGNSGSNNTAVGYMAFQTIGGSGNSALGYKTTVGYGNIQNATAIGAYAEANQDNSLVLGCVAGVNSCPVTTNVGIGNNTPASLLSVGSSSQFQVNSSGNFSTTGTGLVNTASANAFRVQNGSGVQVMNVNASNSSIQIQAGSSSASTGANMFTSSYTLTAPGMPSPPVWVVSGTGSSTTATSTNTGGMGGPPSCTTPNLPIVPGYVYNITFTVSTTTGDGLAPSVGGVMGTYIYTSGTYTQSITAASTTTVCFNGDANWFGNSTNKISNISITQTTPVISTVSLLDSAGTSAVEIRGGSTASKLDTFVGLGSGGQNTSGYDNSGYGYGALQQNTSATDNTAVGAFALQNTTTGFANTSIGSGALRANTTGQWNVAVGVGALATNTTGSGNMALGDGADVASGNLQNATAIGDGAIVAQSNAIVLGGTGTLAVNVGIGTTSPSAPLDVVGAVQTSVNSANATILIDDLAGSSQNQIAIGVAGTTKATIRTDSSGNFVLSGTGTGKLYLNYDAGTGGVQIGQSGFKNNLTVYGTAATCTLGNSTAGDSCTSDARLKTNVMDLTNSLNNVMALRPVTFTWKDPTYPQGTNIGFIAQEVQQVFPESVSLNDSTGYYQLDYASLVVPAIGAIQQQQGEISGLTSQVLGMSTSVNTDSVQAGSLGVSGGTTLQGTTNVQANLNVTGATTLSSLVVNGGVGISGNLNVGGNFAASSLNVNVAVVKGSLSVAGLTTVHDIVVGGHLMSQGNTPTVTLGSAAGEDGQVTIDGTDTAGTLTVTVEAHQPTTQELQQGMLPEVLAPGDMADVTFAQPFQGTPRVVISPDNQDSIGLPVYITKDQNGYHLVITRAAQSGKTYQFDYVILDSSGR